MSFCMAAHYISALAILNPRRLTGGFGMETSKAEILTGTRKALEQTAQNAVG